MDSVIAASTSMKKSHEAWDAFHLRIGACMAHLNDAAVLMGQARHEPGAAARVPAEVVGTLQEHLGVLCRLQEESRLRSAATQRLATALQHMGVEFRNAAGAAAGGGDDAEAAAAGGGGAGAAASGPEAAFLTRGGVVSLLGEEQSRVDAGVGALNVPGSRRWKEAMEAMGEGGGDDDVEVEMEPETGSLKCPITGMAMVDPQRSRECPHRYSLQGIVQHILVNNYAPAHLKNAPPSLSLLGSSTAKCPVVGCSAIIGAASLEKDFDAEMQLRRSQVEASSASAAAPLGDVEEIDEA